MDFTINTHEFEFLVQIAVTLMPSPQIKNQKRTLRTMDRHAALVRRKTRIGVLSIAVMRRFAATCRVAKVLPICATLHLWPVQVQAQSCSILFNAIKAEAMHCGFFCDFKKLRPLQMAYSAECIRVVIPPSLFEIDSQPNEPEPLAGYDDLAGGTTTVGDNARAR